MVKIIVKDTKNNTVVLQRNGVAYRGALSQELLDFIDSIRYEDMSDEEAVAEIKRLLNPREIKLDAINVELAEKYNEEKESFQKMEMIETLYEGIFYTEGNELFHHSGLKVPHFFIDELVQFKDDRLVKFMERWSRCPYEESAADLARFLKDADSMVILKSGHFGAYRRAVLKKTGDPLLNEMVALNSRILAKGKSPDNRMVITNGEKYKAYKEEKANEYVSSGEWEFVSEMVLPLLISTLNADNTTERLYTDNYTKSKSIRVGEVYSETVVDPDRNVDCSQGLHAGNKHFAIDGYGEALLFVVICPSNLVSVPYADAHKIRVSEMFIAAEFETPDHMNEFIANKGWEELDYSSYERFERVLEKAVMDGKKITNQDVIVCIDNKALSDAIQNLRKKKAFIQEQKSLTKIEWSLLKVRETLRRQNT